MSKHVIEFPDCPYCGKEMIRQMRYKEYDEYGYYEKPFFFWQCSICNFRTPLCTIDQDSIKVALETVKRIKGVDNGKETN